MTASAERAIEELIQPWIGGADDDDLTELYREFDSNDRDAVIMAVRRDLKAEYDLMPGRQRDHILAALADVFSSGDCEIQRFWDSLLPPFSLPKDPKSFFQWVAISLQPSER